MNSLSQDKLFQARELWRHAFPEDSEAFVKFYFEEYVDPCNIKVLYEDEALVSMLHMNPYPIRWQGIHHEIHYIVGVATFEQFQGKKYMRSLMLSALNEMYENGETLTCLMPADERYYKSYGFVPIQKERLFEFEPRSIKGHDISDYLATEVTLDEVIGLLPIYNRFKTRYEFTSNRGMRSFNSLYHELSVDGGRLIRFDKGEDEAYVAFYEDEIISVKEVAYDNFEMLKVIADYLCEIAKDRMIHWPMAADSELSYLVPHTIANRVIERPSIMVRIIRVEQFFESISLYLEGLSFQIIDSIFEKNNHIFDIKKSGITISDEIEPDFRMPIEVLTQWLFGFDSLERLASIYSNVIYKENKLLHVQEMMPLLRTNYFIELF